MNHDELADRLEKRLDKIESKLDRHLVQVSTNEADLNWVKGYIRISTTMLTAMVVSVGSLIFKVFIK